MRIPIRLVNICLFLCDLIHADSLYLKIMFYSRLGYRLNLKNPRSFNEKIQWIKLFDRNPKYSEYADKYRVRSFIEKELGKEYLIPLIGVYKNAEEIDFSMLPERFVLKCNHGYGCNIICNDKSKLNIEEAKSKLNGWLKKDYSKFKKEYHYKEIKPLIICEEFMIDNKYQDLFDYKFFCVGGTVQMIQVDFGRFEKHTRNLYDRNWNLLNLEISFPKNSEITLKKPVLLDKMIEFAERLAKGFAQVRVDFYVINERLYFGEMTFTSGAGFSRYKPLSFDYELGSKVVLPIKK